MLIAKENEVRDMVSQYAGPIRRMEELIRADEKINEIFASLDGIKADSLLAFELFNMTTVAKLIFDGAKNRKESIGAHYLV